MLPLQGTIEPPWVAHTLNMGRDKPKLQCRLRSAKRMRSPCLIYFPASGYYTFRNLRPPHFSEVGSACATLQQLTSLDNFNLLVVEYPVSDSQAHYPDALNAAFVALEWASAAVQCDPKKLCLAGNSSGGHLALTTALKWHAEGREPLAGLVLDAPGSDAYVPIVAALKEVSGQVPRMFTYFERCSVRDASADPYLNPFLASDAALATLPPTLVVLTAHDIWSLVHNQDTSDLISSTHRIAARLAKAKVAVTLRVEDGIHGAAWQEGSPSHNVGIAQRIAEWVGARVGKRAVPPSTPADVDPSAGPPARSCVRDLHTFLVNAQDALGQGSLADGQISAWSDIFVPMLRGDNGVVAQPMPCMCRDMNFLRVCQATHRQLYATSAEADVASN